jgi:choline dehydrogenase-like flavoprotein
MTFIDCRKLPDGEVIERDVCIIGSGPAGLAIARELNASTTTVAVLESGGLDIEYEIQSLAWGEVAGRPYPELDVVRLRYFGGTSNHWGGNTKPLDAIDYEPRPWVDHSGWPFDADHMAPYYKRAAAYMGLSQDAYDENKLRLSRGLKPWPSKDDEIASYVFHTISPEYKRLGLAYHDLMKQSDNIDVFLYANVHHISADEPQSTVTGLNVKTLSGVSLTFKAKLYVLATGGIENPRLLLLSRNSSGRSLGNAHDLVGRFFMEHITNPDFGVLIPADPKLSLSYYRSEVAKWGETWGVFGLSQKMQRRHQLPNIRFQVADITNVFNQDEDTPGFQSLKAFADALANRQLPDNVGEHFLNVLKGLDDVVSAAYYRARYDGDYPLVKLRIVAIGEQVPNPESRVRLGAETDALGQPTAVLDWQLAEADTIGLLRSTAFLARALARSGIGRLVDNFPEDGFGSINPKPHFHHMGTTRIHPDPKQGVVDANCRVHGVNNLYIAGSSVFPTGGNVNPTLTIAALAIRLADHLKTLQGTLS